MIYSVEDVGNVSNTLSMSFSLQSFQNIETGNGEEKNLEVVDIVIDNQTKMVRGATGS